MTDITNRAFLSELTRPQLISLLVQHTDMLVSEAQALSDAKLRFFLEELPQEIQQGVQA